MQVEYLKQSLQKEEVANNLSLKAELERLVGDQHDNEVNWIPGSFSFEGVQ